MATIQELKEKSGVKFFASILGKSTIDSNSEEYKAIEKITEILINTNFGVIHGGYGGGAMTAVNDQANALIAEKGLPQERNIGVPQVEHEGLWARVEGAAFVDAAEDIFQRLKIVTSGDIVVICPLGGDGTELEETIVFHENIIRQNLGNKPTPIIFFQTQNGTDWKKLIETKLQVLATSIKSIEECQWLYFVNSFDEFERIVVEIKQ